MQIKVCGMREKDNVRLVASLLPDYMGFIFFATSPRDASSVLQKETIENLPTNIEPVAVFVNKELEEALAILKQNNFKHAQLHGYESPEYCEAIKQHGFGVFKVFSIDESTDFSSMEQYLGMADYFLFDTKSPKHGGTGVKFDWDLLERYKLSKPVLLSGGISSDDVEMVQQALVKYPWIHGLDLNSRFELSPGIKDIEKLRTFFEAFGR
jgi:phosphoribosylanthranilate isomerase